MGVVIDGSVIYIIIYFCVICVKMIVNVGIKKVIYKGLYLDEMSQQIFREVGIEVVKFEENGEGDLK